MIRQEWVDKFHNCLRANCSIHETFNDCEQAIISLIEEAKREIVEENRKRFSGSSGFKKLQDECDLWKSKYETIKRHEGHCDCHDNLDKWKSKAEKLAEALKNISVSVNGNEAAGNWIREKCEEALADYEKKAEK